MSLFNHDYFTNVLEGVTVAALVGIFACTFRFIRKFLNDQEQQTDDISTLQTTSRRQTRILKRHSSRIRSLEDA